jgi:hypothetical protein
MIEMMREVANDVTELLIPHAARWIPEETPGALLEGLHSQRREAAAALRIRVRI